MYIVSIKLEGVEWVARDASNNKRAWGEYKKGLKGQSLAEYLFHKEELGNVTILDGITHAEILEGSECKPTAKQTAERKSSKVEQAYVAAHSRMMELIQATTTAADNIPCQDSPNWEHVGTLAEINRRLEAVLAFINGSEK